MPGHEHHGFETLYNIVLAGRRDRRRSRSRSGSGSGCSYQATWRSTSSRSPFAWIYRFVENKYYLDDLYLKGIVRPIQYPIARATYWSNQKILDGAVNGVGSRRGRAVAARLRQCSISK